MSLWPPALVCSCFFQTAQTPNSIFFPLFCPKQDIFPQKSPLSKLFPSALFCKIKIQITFSQFPTFWMAHVLLSCLFLSLSKRFWPWGPGQAMSRGGRESTGRNRASQSRELTAPIPHVREGAGGAAPRLRTLGAKCSRFFCHFLSKLCLSSCCEGFFWETGMGCGLGTHQDAQIPVLAGFRGVEELVRAQGALTALPRFFTCFIHQSSPHPWRAFKAVWMWHLGTTVG